MADTLKLGDLDTEVTLGLFVKLDGLFQSWLDFNVDTFKLLSSLLELPSRSIGLLQIDDEDLNLRINDLLCKCIKFHKHFLKI